jgi:thiamine-phosphate pyrophosphorylase
VELECWIFCWRLDFSIREPRPPVSLPPPTRNSAPLLCYVTDRRQLSASPEEQKTALLGKVRIAASAGVDWIQIREKDLPAAELSQLVRQAIRSIPDSRLLIVNDRLDVAWAAKASGVHLGEKSISIREAKRFVRDRGGREDFLFGASVHSLEAAQAAQADGANYVIFGPVFATPSKQIYGSPRGLERLAAVCGSLSVPVLAIGGVTPENAHECYSHGASGIAAIRVFQESQDLADVVKRLRGA